MSATIPDMKCYLVFFQYMCWVLHWLGRKTACYSKLYQIILKKLFSLVSYLSSSQVTVRNFSFWRSASLKTQIIFSNNHRSPHINNNSCRIPEFHGPIQSFLSVNGLWCVLRRTSTFFWPIRFTWFDSRNRYFDNSNFLEHQVAVWKTDI